MSPTSRTTTESEAPAPAPASTSAPTSETPPGAFDTSDAVNVTKTFEEAMEAGYLGAVYDDGDYTVKGVTA